MTSTGSAVGPRADVRRPRVAWSPVAGLSLGEAVAASLPIITVYAQMTLLGANTAFLSSIAVVSDLLVALIVILLIGARAPRRLWAGLAIPGALLLAALVWGASGLLPAARSDWTAAYTGAQAGSLLSVSPDRTLLELAKLLGAGALALAAAIAASSPKRLLLCVRLLLVLGAAHTLLGLVLYAIDPDTVAGFYKGGHQWRLTGTLLNANAFATSLAMTAALAAAQFRIELRRFQEAPSGARSNRFILVGVAAMLIFLLAGACALTKSRTALAALALVVITVIFWPARKASGERTAGGWLQAALGLIAAGVSLGLAVALTGGATLDRLSSIEGDLPTRLDAYRLFLTRVAAAPHTGYGLGSFAVVATPGVDLDLGTKIWNMGAAHNAWLQAAMEGGIPYAVLLTLSALAMAAPALVRPATTRSERALRIGLAGALVVVVVCSSVDIALNVPAVAAQAMVVLGLLAGAALGAPVHHSADGRRASPNEGGK
jgi:O-antigen ligase